MRDLLDPPDSLKEVLIEDVVCAYRKAKADAFYERSQYAAESFAAFEAGGLIETLKAFHRRLKKLNDASLPLFVKEELKLSDQQVLLAPKHLNRKPPSKEEQGHLYLSDATSALHHAASTSDLTAAFRTHVPLSVPFRILSALWVNWVGHRHDACLDSSAYGSRLRRYRKSAHASPTDVGEYHLHAPGSFQPYFHAYRRWREDGLSRVRSELNSDRAVVVLTLDLKSYYHNIDPTFAASCVFSDTHVDDEWNELRDGQRRVGEELSRSLVRSYAAIEKHVRAKLKMNDLPVGLPLGDSAARVVANSLLARWDRLIQERLTPLYYGRYVDDMFLVLPAHQHGRVATADVEDRTTEELERIRRALPKGVLNTPKRGGTWEINLDNGSSPAIQGKSKLLLQQSKCKCFVLSGQAGVDLLDSVEKEIRNVASERRLLPEPEYITRSPGAKVLTAAGHPGLEPDTFGRAEGLTVRRLGWSIQMWQAETLAQDLKRAAWKEERRTLYRFATDHVLTPLAILDQFQSLPRIIGLAVSMRDWAEAHRLADVCVHSLDALVEALDANKKSHPKYFEINGRDCTVNKELVRRSHSMLRHVLSNAVVTSWPWRKLAPVEPTAGTAARLIAQYVDIENFGQAVRDIANSDFGRTSYADWHKPKRFRDRQSDEAELWKPNNKSLSRWIITKEGGPDRASGLVRFLNESRKDRLKNGVKESMIPFLFPTRPYRPEQITRRVPSCVIGDGKNATETPLHKLALYVCALRGTWVAPDALEGSSPGHSAGGRKPPIVRVGLGARKTVRVAVANWVTKNAAWHQAAIGKPDLSLDRYSKLAQLINSVVTLNSNQRPDYLVLPELSLPQRWVESTANRLLAAGVSLVAGVEYVQFSKRSSKASKEQLPRRVSNKVELVLSDDRLGYPTAVQLSHWKSAPSKDEERLLSDLHGRVLSPKPHYNRVYLHNGFAFGILICSELQNVAYQTNLRGSVDAVIVPSWNKDLKTYGPLVDAAGFGMHSYVVYVNNGMYGDSRLRAPRRLDYLQDVCRVKGGKNAYVVVADIQVEELRRFQTRHVSGEGPFKPTPDGFKCASFRKWRPAK